MKIIKMSIQINFSLVLNRNKVLSSPTPLGCCHHPPSNIYISYFISVTLVEALFYCHVLLKMCRKINQACTFDFFYFFFWWTILYYLYFYNNRIWFFLVCLCFRKGDRSGVCEMFQEIVIKKQIKEEITQSVGFTNML